MSNVTHADLNYVKSIVSSEDAINNVRDNPKNILNINAVDWHKATELDDEHKNKFSQLLANYSSSRSIGMVIALALFMVGTVAVGILFTKSNGPDDGSRMILYCAILVLVLILCIIFILHSMHKVKEAIANDDYYFGCGIVTSMNRHTEKYHCEESRTGSERVKEEVIVNYSLEIPTSTKYAYSDFHVGEEIILLRAHNLIIGIPNNK